MDRLESYKLLEIEENASKEDIKRAYRRLAKKWHPDVNNSPDATEKFKKINEAYQTLITEESSPFAGLFDSLFTNIPIRNFSFEWSTFGGDDSITIQIDKLDKEGGEKIVNLIREAGFTIRGYTIQTKGR